MRVTDNQITNFLKINCLNRSALLCSPLNAVTFIKFHFVAFRTILTQPFEVLEKYFHLIFNSRPFLVIHLLTENNVRPFRGLTSKINYWSLSTLDIFIRIVTTELLTPSIQFPSGQVYF